MKHLLLLLVGWFSFATLPAQIELDHYVIASMGGHSFDSTLSVSYTVGQIEVATLTSNNGSLVLTQGFQQPEMLGVNIDDELEVVLNYQIYPNPTARILNVKITTDRTVELELSMANLLGQPIGIPAQKQKVNGEWEARFDLEGAAEGYYFLLLRNEAGELAGSWKIHKLN
jgi:hypothetical protein